MKMGVRQLAWRLFPRNMTRRYFDAKHYLACYPDILAESIEPFDHFWRHGASEGRSPAKWFDTATYIRENSDVKASQQNPFTHFLSHGVIEGRIATAASAAGTT